MEEVKGIQLVTITQKDLTDKGSALTEKIQAAAKMGIFSVEMSPEQSKLFPDTLKFASEWYKDEDFKKLNFGGYNKYNDQPELQMESFFCEREFWSQAYPEAVQQMGQEMNVMALTLLEETQKACGIPMDAWTKAMEGLDEDKGARHFSFYHMREEKELPGSPETKDFSLLSVFHQADDHEIKFEDSWVQLPTEKGHFTILFGQTMEAFVNDPSVLQAVAHRAPQVEHKDLAAFGLYVDPETDATVYCHVGGGKVEKLFDTHREFVTQCFKEAYGDSAPTEDAGDKKE